MRVAEYSLAIFLTVATSHLFSNDAIVEIAGGSDGLVIEASNQIEMQSEQINIDLMKDKFCVDVTAKFYNHGDEITVDVGFPNWGFYQVDGKEFDHFQTWVNGIEADYFVVPHPMEPSPNDPLDIDYWNVKKVRFASQKTTETRVRYVIGYYSSWGSHGKAVHYLYGTGASWKGSIGNITVIIKTVPDLWLNGNNFEYRRGFKSFVQHSENEYVLYFENVEPSKHEAFQITLNHLPVWDTIYELSPTGDYLDEFILDAIDLQLLNLDQLKLFRAFYFAAYGHRFAKNEYTDFFTKYDWYKPKGTVAFSNFSPVIQDNLLLISHYIEIKEGLKQPMSVVP